MRVLLRREHNVFYIENTTFSKFGWLFILSRQGATAVLGQNGSGQNGMDKMVQTKWYRQNGTDKMVQIKWYR